MSKGLKIAIAVLSAVLVLSVGLLVGMIVFQNNYLIDGKFYPKDSRTLDLQGKKITAEHFENIRQKLPHCEIVWDVPLQEGAAPSNSQELTVTALTEADLSLMGYFTGLTRVDATACKETDLLLALKESYPELEIACLVTIDGKEYPSDAAALTVSSLTDRDVELMTLLSGPETVDAHGCEDYAQLAQLQELFPECQVSFDLVLDGERYASDSRELTLQSQSLQNLLEKLPAMPVLEKVTLLDPEGTPEELEQLRAVMPGTEFALEADILGVRIRSDMTEVDLSTVTGFTLAQVEKAMEWFPDVNQVFLGECGIDNEEIAAFRELHKEDYKVVWTVQCGKLTVRTDDKGFIPVKHRVYYFFNEDCYNLRYCNEMEALDIGHMPVSDISFLEGMTNLKYLVLAHTFVTDITPISTCKNLLFLELDFSIVRDFTPLLGCTSLQDLNIGNTYADVEPLLGMTWLNNLWCVKRGYGSYKILLDGMPSTVHINYQGGATVANGWRKLDNYYAMRDTLGMHYMD